MTVAITAGTGSMMLAIGSTRRADARRDEKLRRLGYHVLRLDANVVLCDLPRAVALVRDAVESMAR